MLLAPNRPVKNRCISIASEEEAEQMALEAVKNNNIDELQNIFKHPLFDDTYGTGIIWELICEAQSYENLEMVEMIFDHLISTDQKINMYQILDCCHNNINAVIRMLKKYGIDLYQQDCDIIYYCIIGVEKLDLLRKVLDMGKFSRSVINRAIECVKTQTYSSLHRTNMERCEYHSFDGKIWRDCTDKKFYRAKKEYFEEVVEILKMYL